MMKVETFLVLICATFVAGKYEIYLDRIDSNFDSTLLDISNVRVKKFNRTATVVSGYYKVLKPFGNNLEIDIEASNLQGGQYKMMLQKNLGKFCDLMWTGHLRDEINRLRQGTNMTLADDECPLKAQTIAVNNYTPKDFGDFLPEYIPGNERWKIKAIFSEDGKPLAGFDLYAILRTKESMFTNISSGKK